MGGKKKPLAEMHDKIVCVFPLSAADTAYTFLRPNSATTLLGLKTIVTPVRHSYIFASFLILN